MLVPLIGWCSWVTIHAFLAASNRKELERMRTEQVAELKAYVDMQVGVLHGRVTAVAVGQEADETRLENRMWELQLRFFEDKIEDCQEELEECKE